MPLVEILKSQARKYGSVRIQRDGNEIYATAFGGTRVTFYINGKMSAARKVTARFDTANSSAPA